MVRRMYSKLLLLIARVLVCIRLHHLRCWLEHRVLRLRLSVLLVMLRFRWLGLRLRPLVDHQSLIMWFSIPLTLVRPGQHLRMERLHRLLQLLLV